MSIIRNSDNANGPHIDFAKSRSGSLGGNTVVQDGDALGAITFIGADGADTLSEAGRILCQVDGTPADDTSDMPGRLVFKTTADGASSGTERLRIDSSGSVRIENTDYAAQASGNELIVGTTTGDNGITIASASSGTGNIYFGDGDSNSIGYMLSLIHI